MDPVSSTCAGAYIKFVSVPAECIFMRYRRIFMTDRSLYMFAYAGYICVYARPRDRVSADAKESRPIANKLAITGMSERVFNECYTRLRSWTIITSRPFRIICELLRIAY
jgi:hypothetical protein